MSIATEINLVDLIVGLLTVLATIVVVFIGGKQWKTQKQKELTIAVNQNIEDKKLAALTAVWTLLRFITHADNGQNIYVKNKEDNYQKTYQSIERSQQFYTAIREVFYDEGHGLYISQYYPNIRDQVYQCRMHYKRFEDKHQKNNTVITNKLIPVEERGVKQAKTHYNTLNKLLKKAIKEFEKTPNWLL